MPYDPLPVHQPIQLCVVDLDNTLNPSEGQQFNLPLLERIHERNHESEEDATVPPLTLITGRPQPYLECMLQITASRLPGVFEHGLGMFNRLTDKLQFHPKWTPGLAHGRERLLALCEAAFVAPKRAFVQIGKVAALTLVPLRPHTAAELEPIAEEVLREVGGGFSLHIGPKVVDFVPEGFDKGAGVRWLAKALHVPLSAVAVMGDSTTDALMFPGAGLSVAPSNAPQMVRNQAKLVTDEETTAGVLEAYDRLIAHNRAIMPHEN